MGPMEPCGTEHRKEAVAEPTAQRRISSKSGGRTCPERIRAEAREPDREEIAYVVRGQSFLRYMVRKIVGTLIEVGKGRLVPDDIPKLFDLRDRSRSGPTVAPEGLYLVSLEFPDPTDSLASSAFRRRVAS